MVKTRAVPRMPAGQQGDAAYAKSVRGVPWKRNPAEAVEGERLDMAMLHVVSVPMVAIEHRLGVPVMEPRDYKARRLYIWREVELTK